jgi:hypothetical protein
MLKISVIETHSQCRLGLQGKLMEPWIGVLKMACENAVAEIARAAEREMSAVGG